MSIPYESSAVLDTPMPNPNSNIEYPFVSLGDNSSKIYNIHCVVKDADYVPLALNTIMSDAATADVTSLPFAADSAAYHVGDYSHQIVDGVFRSFNRRFANIPNTNISTSGTEIFTFPGLPPTVGTEAAIDIASVTSTTTELTMTLDSAHGMVVGDNFRLYTEFAYSPGPGYSWTSVGTSHHIAIAIPSTTQLTYRGYFGVPENFVKGNIIPKTSRGRSQISQPSITQTQREYYLPGVTSGVSSVEEIPLEQPFEAYSPTLGKVVASLSAITSPTNVEYDAMVEANAYLNMGENITQWLGDIVVKETKQIRAV